MILITQISGAGIGGLTTASEYMKSFANFPILLLKNYVVALAQYPDIEVDIYEGAERLAEVGAGLGVWPSEYTSF